MKLKLLIIPLLQIALMNSVAAKETATFNLEEATIESVHTAIKNQQITCVQLVQAYLERIKKYNLSVASQPPINAFTEINPSVLSEAQQIDTTYLKTKKMIGSLHCVPVILKDNIDSFDTTTTSGSFALLGNQPIQDAVLTARLRKAGAIILGKGGMDEFAWGLVGISSRSGRIGNAYDPTKNPGGSSGGPAAAVSANFALIGIGTDNSGSVRIPAAFNGLVGLRPTMGLISQNGIFPMGNLDGTAGPLARTTKDLAIVLDVLAKPNETKNYMVFLNSNGLRSKRIGIVQRVGDIDVYRAMPTHIKQVFTYSLQKMQQLGATTINIHLPKFDNNRKFNQAGETEDVNAYLAAFPATRKNFHDICESDRTRTFGSTIKKCLQFVESTPKKDSAQYQEVLALFAKNKKYIEKIMQENHLDALFIPISTQGSATYDAMTINTWRAPVSSNAGLPSITINVGNDQNNLPIGAELVGKPFAEGTLLEIAYAYEQHAPTRKIPPLPEENLALTNFSIPQLNNLLTFIGKDTYEKILKNRGSNHSRKDTLTADTFRRIVASEFKRP